MKNKLISFILALCLLIAIPLSARYKYNPFTRKLDYYETGADIDLGDLADVTLTGLATGNILYYNGTAWVNLATGANGRVLTLAAGIPSWAAGGAPAAHAASHEVGGADLVDHDQLTNYLAAQHLTLPNTIVAVLTDHNLAAHTALGLFDASGDVDHDATTNWVANKHIDWTNATQNFSTQGSASLNDNGSTGEIGLNLYSINATFSTIAQSDAEGIANKSDLRIGLDETTRRLIICDYGDIGVDYGFLDAEFPDPTICLFNNDNSSDLMLTQLQDGTSWIEATSGGDLSLTTWGTASMIKLDTGTQAATFSFKGEDDTKAMIHNAGEGVWMNVRPAVNQTGTASYVGLLVDAQETSTGSGVNELMALRVAGTDVFTVGHTGSLDLDLTQTTDRVEIIMHNAVGTEDQPLFLVLDDRDGTTVDEKGEATLKISTERATSWGLLVTPGQAQFDGDTIQTEDIFWTWADAGDHAKLLQTSVTGIENQALIEIDDQREGATVDEAHEASLVINADGPAYGLYVMDGKFRNAEPSELAGDVTMNEDVFVTWADAIDKMVIAQSSATGTEDQPLIFIDDDRTGATVNEESEATIFMDTVGAYALYIADGYFRTADRAYFDGRVYLNLGAYIADDKYLHWGTGEDLLWLWDQNGAGDDLFVMYTAGMAGANETEALFISNLNPTAMTDHDNYLSPTLIITNDEAADANDYAGVVIGERTQASVLVAHYFDFYAMTGASDGAVDPNAAEVAAIFRFGASGSSVPTHATTPGDVILEGNLEVDGNVYVDGSSLIMYDPIGGDTTFTIDWAGDNYPRFGTSGVNTQMIGSLIVASGNITLSAVDKQFAISNGVYRSDGNAAQDGLIVFGITQSATASAAFFFTDQAQNPAGMTDHIDYKSPTFILTNLQGADANDYAGVVIGERAQADVKVAHYFDFYAMTGATDGSADPANAELASIFRFGASGTTVPTTATSPGDVLFEGKIEAVNWIKYDETDYNQTYGYQAGNNLTATEALENILIGSQAGLDLTTGDGNVSIGYHADYENATGDNNVAIGYEALMGAAGQDHSSNVAVGYQAMRLITTGNSNVGVGLQAGTALTSGGNNVFVGNFAGGGTSTTSNNMFLGYYAGGDCQGSNNVAVGYQAGYRMDAGSTNVNVGYRTGAGQNGFNQSNTVHVGADAARRIKQASGQVAIGAEAGYYNIDATGNVLIGYQAAKGTADNDFGQNTIIGYQAALNITTGDGNVVIGYMAGEGWLDTEAEILVIDNSDTATPLIYGDFNTDILTINGDLHVTGEIESGVYIVSAVVNFDDGSPVAIATVADGYAVTDVFVEITTTWDGNGTIVVGDGNDPDGFMEDAGIDQGVAAYYGHEHDERGTYLWHGAGTHSDCLIYTGADTVDATLVAGTSTQGVATVFVQITRLK